LPAGHGPAFLIHTAAASPPHLLLPLLLLLLLLLLQAAQAPGWLALLRSPDTGSSSVIAPTRQQLAQLKAAHTPETEEYNISSFVYRARWASFCAVMLSTYLKLEHLGGV
jgi:hypothetical protein